MTPRNIKKMTAWIVQITGLITAITGLIKTLTEITIPRFLPPRHTVGNEPLKYFFYGPLFIILGTLMYKGAQWWRTRSIKLND